MVSFPTLPINLREPGQFGEFDNSFANVGPSIQPFTALMIGQKLSAGTATANQIYSLTSADQAKGLFGQGSVLHLMARKWFQNNTTSSLKAVAMADTGAAAAGSLTVTGPATAAGTIKIYIAGQLVQVTVASGDAQNTIAAAIDAAINALPDLPVSSTVATNVVTVTSKHTGEVGNDIKMFLNLFDGEVLPAGVAVTPVQLTGGTGVPSLTNVIAAMGEDQYNVVVWPYQTTGTHHTALLTELADRFGPIRQIEGLAFACKRETHANLVSFGNGLNSQFISFMGIEPSTPSLNYEVAAALAARATSAFQADPARPLQTLSMLGIFPTNKAERFTYSERNLLLQDGIATQFVDAGGVMLIGRTITTYQVNSFGLADPSYLDAETFFTLSYIRYDLRATWSQKYPRHKLASDASAKRFGPGQAVMTPTVARAELIAKFMQWEELALVEDIDQFKNDLIVQVSATDPNRLDVLLPPNLVNQLRISAFLIQFRL